MVRYVDSCTLKQVLVRLHTVLKPVTAAELTRFINTTLSVECQIDGPNVVAAMRDSAAVSGAAMRNLTILYPNIMDITCFSHTANNTGKHFQFEALHFTTTAACCGCPSMLAVLLFSAQSQHSLCGIL